MVIYFILNKINGKYYIGQTSQNISSRWASHKSASLRKNMENKRTCYLYNAIRKYGPENFEIRVLFTCFDRRTLNEAEIYFIDFFDSRDRRYGYNSRVGGEGGSPNQETRKRLSVSLKKYISGVDRTGNNNPFFGRKHTEETKEKLRKARKGKNIIFSKEHREALVEAWKRRKEKDIR